jgi:hypothetical protein
MDVEDEGVRDQNNTAVAKSEGASVGDVKDDGGLPIPPSKLAADPEVAPEPVEDKGGDTTECSSSFGNTFSGFDDEADGGEPEVNSQVLDPADGDLASMLPRRKKGACSNREGKATTTGSKQNKWFYARCDTDWQRS